MNDNHLYINYIHIETSYSPGSTPRFPATGFHHLRHGAMAKSNAPVLPGPVQHAFEARRWVNGFMVKP